jgi:tetratricopeptide (TPR) repeat protein
LIARLPYLLIAVTVLLAAGSPAHGQSTPHATHAVPTVPIDVVERPIAFMSGIGIAHDPIATSSRDAQAFYDQGIAFLHSYSWIDAARSFHQALRTDPSLAMAHVGLSYAMFEVYGLKEARAAMDRARALERSASPRERQRIALRSLHLEAMAAVPADAAARRASYVRAIDEALAADPSDVELLLMRAIAEDPDIAGRGQSAGASAIPFLQRALAANPGSFAPHHYLTHSYEMTGRLDEALKHGETFARLAPAVPHARHMYGHNLRRVGRIQEAIAEFRAAYDLETAPSRAAEVPPEHDWHHQHNLDLLATSYQYVGQLKTAEPLLRRSFDIPSSFVVQEYNKHEWPTFLLARGRTDEALGAARTMIGHQTPVVRATGHIMAGRAHLARKQFKEAADATNAALKELRQAGPTAALAGPDFEALQAEFFLRTGQREKGETLIREVVRKLRARPGPDAWSQTLFRLESLARSAMAADAWELAGFIATEIRDHDAAYAGTQDVLGLVADHKGDRAAALQAYAAAERAWSAADPDLPELARFRARLEALR